MKDLFLLNPRAARPAPVDGGEDAFAHIHPSLRLRISRRAKRIALRLDPSKHVVNLVVPVRFSMKKAEAFALQHKQWIHDKLAELPSPIAFEHGTVLPLFGQQKRLNITYDPSFKVTHIILDDGEIAVFTNQQDPTARIVRFLRKEAREVMGALAREKAERIGKTVQSVQVRDTTSRWGSCGPDGRISLSWRLIFAPHEAMDYVVAHEVAHLVHMNHGKKFWALCADLCENYASGKRWIRSHGHELQRYG